ncbi:MAG: hypothetical protein AMXMBFR82_13950 [Candidatus Hydrogenedentota bacterium]
MGLLKPFPVGAVRRSPRAATDEQQRERAARRHPQTRRPGFGDVDFAPFFEALKDINYEGYVSVEVFIFDRGPEIIAEKSRKYMKPFV